MRQGLRGRLQAESKFIPLVVRESLSRNYAPNHLSSTSETSAKLALTVRCHRDGERGGPSRFVAKRKQDADCFRP